MSRGVAHPLATVTSARLPFRGGPLVPRHCGAVPPPGHDQGRQQIVGGRQPIPRRIVGLAAGAMQQRGHPGQEDEAGGGPPRVTEIRCPTGSVVPVRRSPSRGGNLFATGDQRGQKQPVVDPASHRQADRQADIDQQVMQMLAGGEMPAGRGARIDFMARAPILPRPQFQTQPRHLAGRQPQDQAPCLDAPQQGAGQDQG